MRSITDQLLEIVRSGLATVKTLNDSTQDAINVTAIRRFFPAIDPGRLGAAWKDRPGTGEPDSVFERIKRYLEDARDATATVPHIGFTRTEEATVVRAEIRNRPFQGNADVRLNSRFRIPIGIVNSNGNYPQTVTTTLVRETNRGVQVGDIIQVDRDREGLENRHARVVEVDQFSEDTVVLTVRWYKNAGHGQAGTVPTQGPDVLQN